jgi:hypothetical protein
VDLNRYREQVVNVGFNQALYLVYQEFKRSVDSCMADKINPQIVGFIGRLEKRLKEYFKSLVDPFEAMVRDAVLQYERVLAKLEIEQIPGQWTMDTMPDIENIKQSTGLELPAAKAAMRYSAHIKTDAVLRLGFHALIGMFSKLFKKQGGSKGRQQIEALKGGIHRMKRETVRSLYEHFKDYRENIKFQYILRLTDATKNRLYEGLTEHFRAYLSGLKDVISSMAMERKDKTSLDGTLKEIESDVTASISQLEVLRQDIGQIRNKGHQRQWE